MRIPDRRNGFTLIEIVVVLVIISILSTIAVTNYRKVETLTAVGVLEQTLSDIEQALAEALLEGASPRINNPIRANNVESSILANYLTAATFENVPEGLRIEVTGGNPAANGMEGYNLRITLHSSTPEAERILRVFHEHHPKGSLMAGSGYGWVEYNTSTLTQLTEDDGFS